MSNNQEKSFTHTRNKPDTSCPIFNDENKESINLTYTNNNTILSITKHNVPEIAELYDAFNSFAIGISFHQDAIDNIILELADNIKEKNKNQSVSDEDYKAEQDIIEKRNDYFPS